MRFLYVRVWAEGVKLQLQNESEGELIKVGTLFPFNYRVFAEPPISQHIRYRGALCRGALMGAVQDWGGEGVTPCMDRSHMSACHDVCLCEQMKNEAEARRQQYILEGEGEAQAIRLRAQVLLRQTGPAPSSVKLTSTVLDMSTRAIGLNGPPTLSTTFLDRLGCSLMGSMFVLQAYAEAINVVAEALSTNKGMDAAKIQVSPATRSSSQHIDMVVHMACKHHVQR